MVSSMTGYGRGEVTRNGITAVAELRSINSRYFEVTTRLTRTLGLRENDIKELIRRKIVRGKISAIVTVDHEAAKALPVRVNVPAARAAYKVLSDLRKATKMREKITMDHLLKFSEVLEPLEPTEGDEKEWDVVRTAIDKATDDLITMRMKEGKEITHDVLNRIRDLERIVGEIEQASAQRIPDERIRIRERIASVLEDQSVIDGNRLELEIALLADKIDITEECVRFRSHIKFFAEALEKDEAAGRKLNFLLQEMNREANTIGSKASDATISQKVVVMKEEMEKVREQLQNIE